MAAESSSCIARRAPHASAVAQQVTKEEVPGIRNLSRLETTVACAGATEVEAIPNVKKMGFVSMINLRQASEPGANVPQAKRPQRPPGLKYIHIPFDAAAPDPAVADRFLAAIKSPATSPRTSTARARTAPRRCGSSSACRSTAGRPIAR